MLSSLGIQWEHVGPKVAVYGDNGNYDEFHENRNKYRPSLEDIKKQQVKKMDQNITVQK